MNFADFAYLTLSFKNIVRKIRNNKQFNPVFVSNPQSSASPSQQATSTPDADTCTVVSLNKPAQAGKIKH
jgi:hypothetical protein